MAQHDVVPSSPSIVTLRSLIKKLLLKLHTISAAGSGQSIFEELADGWRELHLMLVNSSLGNSGLNEAFRGAGGFDLIRDSLQFLSNVQPLSGTPHPPIRRSLLEFLKTKLDAVSELLIHQAGTQGPSCSPTHRDIFHRLERSVCHVAGISSYNDDESVEWIPELPRVFDLLFRFALKDEAFETEVKLVDREGGHQHELSTNRSLFYMPARLSAYRDQIQVLEKTVDAGPESHSILRIPAAIPIIVRLWSLLPLHSSSRESPHVRLATSVAVRLLQVSSSSVHNCWEIHREGVLRSLITLLRLQIQSPAISFCLENLCLQLMRFGFNDLDDAIRFFHLSRDSEKSIELLQEAIKASREPPSFHFDQSLHGYSSLELRDTKPGFPPQEPSSGYTFVAWLRVDEYDPTCHTTIFGAFDESQTCFLLIYLERDSRHLVLQSSVTSSKPSVRFKSVVFSERRWYHVALVHRRPLSDIHGRATLFVNGKLCEQVKCHYPANPPERQSRETGSRIRAVHESEQRRFHIQAFCGTPRDLTTRLGTGMLRSKWSLASLHLFSDVLSDELIFVYKSLGPNYSGNFQDSLSSFLTYRASTALNLRNEMLGSSAENGSVFSAVMKAKGGRLNPGRNLLLGLSPTASIQYAQTAHVPSPSPRHILYPPVAVNLAVPSAQEALSAPFGTAIPAGGTTVCLSQRIDDCFWRVCGCVPLALSIVQSASTQLQVFKALGTVFELVKENWRNSESFERENGYAILAWLLRAKLVEPFDISREHCKPTDHTDQDDDQDQYVQKIFNLILDFTGYDEKDIKRSAIVNPLAYRALVVDSDIWRSHNASIQRTYYDQFVNLVSASQHSQFNARRLSRMRVAKKMLETLKSEPIALSVLPSTAKSLRAILEKTSSPDMFRSLAMYVTYAINKDSQDGSRRKKASSPPSEHIKTLQRRSTEPVPATRETDNVSPSSKMHSDFELGAEVLRMLANIITEDMNGNHARRFARNVTSKWLLNLLLHDNDRVLGPVTRIIARLVVVCGSTYATRFESGNKGFLIMQARLKNAWPLREVWIACFCVLFSVDIAKIQSERFLETQYAIQTFSMLGKSTVTCPAIFQVMIAMLEEGFSAVENKASRKIRTLQEPVTGDLECPTEPENPSNTEALLASICNLLLEMLNEFDEFRNFAMSSTFVKDIMKVLFSACGARQQFSAFGSQGDDVSDNENQDPRMTEDSQTKESEASKTNISPHPGIVRRRKSSFVVISQPSQKEVRKDPADTFSTPSSHHDWLKRFESQHVQNIVRLLMRVFIEQILFRKDFSGLGLFLKAPPSEPGDRAHVNSMLILGTADSICKEIEKRPDLLLEPRNLFNISRFTTQAYEACVEGWYLDGGPQIIRFISKLMNLVERDDIRLHKSVRLSSPALSSIKSVFRRAAVSTLIAVDNGDVKDKRCGLLEMLSRYDNLLLIVDDGEDTNLEPLCQLMYRFLRKEDNYSFEHSAAILRFIAVKQPHQFANSFSNNNAPTHQLPVNSFTEALNSPVGDLKAWIENSAETFDTTVATLTEQSLTLFISEENESNDRLAKSRVSRRKDRLEQWHMEAITMSHALIEYEEAARTWNSNIHVAELLKRQRFRQDQQENVEYLQSRFAKCLNELNRLHLQNDKLVKTKWQLDECEGRERMRLRLCPSQETSQYQYEPRRAKSNRATLFRSGTPATNSTRSKSSSVRSFSATNRKPSDEPRRLDRQTSMSFPPESAVTGDDYEIIVNPAPPDEEDEDKNRKVMRSLERGEKVLNVYNVSRIIGLEACEGLLIIGKNHLYLVDNLFQRSDGEVVHAFEAPLKERDPYTRIISGNEVDPQKARLDTAGYSRTAWPWADILSFSRRHFLTRDVALEVFFKDGRSYLLTAINNNNRDSLHLDLMKQTEGHQLQSSDEATDQDWRPEHLKLSQDTPTSLSSRLASAFSPIMTDPMTKRWIKGELSNFHYLMMINTRAGRTFNDLTQYPVFPWVIADYKSSELDLTNPRVYRDLSKPMLTVFHRGCQSPERETTFRDRYLSFAEMDNQTPAFHYGTHYSSAMIVTSYLIRLQPFVHSHVLLQGGSFDHADRLFNSIEQAWVSASKETLSDVRELTPEFFYLPDFLLNINQYNFGTRDGSGEEVNDVKLPPWARGDPQIFIAKHREALESPYVSQNLHSWIDLIFGFKQRGEAALESTNVFHHLSYSGSRDLDNITDPLDKKATIGIIHNFGQTPQQIFGRPHERRDELPDRAERLVKSYQSLTRTQQPTYELSGSVTAMYYPLRQQKLFMSRSNETLLSPHYNVSMQWGFNDHSVRFLTSDRGKVLEIFEQVHTQKVSTALCADSKTVVTASEDCTVAVWNLSSDKDTMHLHLKANLFCHRSAVSVLAVSNAFGTLLSGSVDGIVMLWDLNRLEMIRQINAHRTVHNAQISNMSGRVLLCSGLHARLYSLNGHLLLDQDLSSAMRTPKAGLSNEEDADPITCCAFHETPSTAWFSAEIIFTGHRRGMVKVWSLETDSSGRWYLSLLRQLEHPDARSGSSGASVQRRRSSGVRTAPAITSVLPLEQKVFVGDEDGRVFEWNAVR